MQDVDDTYRKVGIRRPHDFQVASWACILKGRNAVLSAGTGRGKTEAALLPSIASGGRIIVLYPTKALIQDQLSRIEQLAKGKRIGIDTGDQGDQHFYHADVILTSLDKFLYRLFGYGKRRWSYLYPYRIGFQQDRRTILVLDEAHAYEDVSFSHFWFVLKKLTYERRIQTVLLSATLPRDLLEALEDLQFRWFPRPTHEGSFFARISDEGASGGRLAYAGIVDAAAVVERALAEFRERKRVIIVLDRVVGASSEPGAPLTVQGVWEELVRREPEGAPGELSRPSPAVMNDDHEVSGNVLTYHGHQMPRYRAAVLKRLKELDGRWKSAEKEDPKAGEPFILLTTSALEVGVDISSDVMITDACEPDSFVQRIGRCARRSGEFGQVYLIAGAEGRMRPGSKLLWGFMSKRVAGALLDSSAKDELNKLNRSPNVSAIPLRLEYLQDQSLYRYVYDFVEENRELWERGIIVTREWEPAITLVLGEAREEEPYIGGIKARDFWEGKPVEEKHLLPVSCAASLSGYCAWVLEGYNEGFQHTQRVAVGGSKDRTLWEALEFAGVRPGKGRGENRVGPVYAGLGISLILVLTAEPGRATPAYRDPNLGLSYARRRVTEAEGKIFPPSPSPLLRVGKAVLHKGKEYELPLYWLEPKGDGEEAS